MHRVGVAHFLFALVAGAVVTLLLIQMTPGMGLPTLVWKPSLTLDWIDLVPIGFALVMAASLVYAGTELVVGEPLTEIKSPGVVLKIFSFTIPTTLLLSGVFLIISGLILTLT